MILEVLNHSNSNHDIFDRNTITYCTFALQDGFLLQKVQDMADIHFKILNILPF